MELQRDGGRALSALHPVASSLLCPHCLEEISCQMECIQKSMTRMVEVSTVCFRKRRMEMLRSAKSGRLQLEVARCLTLAFLFVCLQFQLYE